jgi:hypothetical protein
MNEDTPELYRTLGRIEGKLEALMINLQDHVKQDEKSWDKVNRMDKRIMWFSGVMAGAGFIITAVLKKLGLLT